MTSIGYASLLLALLAALGSALAAAWGARVRHSQWVRHAEKGLLVVAGLLAFATAILLHLLLARNFQSRYVYAHASSYQPTLYLISALWAGQEGSLLLWSLLLGVITAIAILRGQRWLGVAWPHFVTILATLHAFFALMLVTVQNPFTTLPTPPAEGLGILPILENVGMVVHPPVLFLGYATYGMPFAITVARLMAGRTDLSASTGLRWTRQWSMLAWLFLGAGILIGAWWAYVELGWGGYWSWDPVENASLVPWLVGTAFLHTLTAQEHRGSFKRWNATLPIVTFLLCIFATLVTRGGIIISDLHGFSRSLHPVAYFLIGFIGAVMLLSAVLLYLRRDELRDDEQGEQLLSRESALILTNLLMVGLGAAIFIGIIFPNFAQMTWGARIHLGHPYYNRVFAPLASVIIVLIAICPLLGWGHTSSKKLLPHILAAGASAMVLGALLWLLGWRQPFALLAFVLVTFAAASITLDLVRNAFRRSRLRAEHALRAAVGLFSSNPRRYGAQMVHFSILLIAAGITGSSLYKTETLVTLAPGQTASIQDYTLQYEGLATVDEPGRVRYIATVGVYRGQARIGTLKPEKNFHWNIEDFVTEVSIHTTLKDDLYVAFAEPQEGGRLTFRVSVYPLVVWLWIGAALLLLGTLIAVWPSRTQRRAA